LGPSWVLTLVSPQAIGVAGRQRKVRPVSVHLKIEVEREDDGRWIAEILDVPGALAYGADPRSAVRAAKSIALSVLSTRAKNEEIDSIEFATVAM
jgi:predicted RNase H-like HicB family nuclease